MLRIKLLFLLFLLSFSFLQAEVMDIKVSVKNGTTGGIGKADTIRIIALNAGMTPLGEFKDKQGTFSLEKIDAPGDVPLLLQVSYKGANYNKMIPPTPEVRNKVQEITVYDITSDIKKITIKNLMQIIREENAIRVYKIFLIENRTNPPQAYQDIQKPLEIFIPSDAQEIRGQINQSDTKMGIPLTFRDGVKGKVMDRPILPGNSELQISYSLAAKSLADVSFKDEYIIEDRKTPQAIFFKPKDMKINVKGATEVKEITENIPHQIGGLSVTYPASFSVEISVSGGTPGHEEMEHSAESRKVQNGNIFTSWDKSLLGVIVFVAMFFSLSALVYFKK